MTADVRAPSCIVCGAHQLRDHAGRRLALCAHCGALERHRALAASFADRFAEGRGRSALEIGPLSPICFKAFLEHRGWAHTSVDMWRTGNPHDPRSVGFVDLELDVSDMHVFEPGAFDLVIAQHVIEEVPDFLSALDEIRRVLRAGGLALLEIPYDPDQPASSRQPPDHFGNVWRFGRDLVDELRARFDEVVAHPLEERDYRGRVFACG